MLLRKPEGCAVRGDAVLAPPARLKQIALAKRLRAEKSTAAAAWRPNAQACKEYLPVPTCRKAVFLASTKVATALSGGTPFRDGNSPMTSASLLASDNQSSSPSSPV